MSFKNSIPGGVRTHAPLIKSQLLYQLSYGVRLFLGGAKVGNILELTIRKTKV